MDENSFELARIAPSVDGVRLSGCAFIAEAGAPLRIDYDIDASTDWETRRVSVRQTYRGEVRRLRLAHAGGEWTRNGVPAPELTGCTDVDLGVSPSTNALPINRLHLAVGEGQSIRAAWIRFPSLETTPATQSYERTQASQYRYLALASGFQALVDVDANGLPVEYQGVWRRIAEAPAAGGQSTLSLASTAGEFVESLLAQAPSSELGDAARDFDWLVGGWAARIEDFDGGAIREGAGEWWFSWVLEGRAIQDVWISPPRESRSRHQAAANRFGSTLRWFDASAKQWRVQWVNPVSGAANMLVGGREGDRIVLNGGGRASSIRWSFNDITSSSCRWLGEAASADGRWTKQAEFHLNRIS